MRRLALLFLLLGSQLSALAQSPDDTGDTPEGPPWYRVEIIVFANRDPQARTAEHWEPLPELQYPARWQRVYDGEATRPGDEPMALVPLEAQLPPAAAMDLFWDRPVAELLAEYAFWQSRDRFTLALEPLVDLTVPVPMRRLGEDARDFRRQQRSIERARNLDVLYHGAWLQRLRPRENSTPILLSGGEYRGDFPELQGSILLYLSRYLHLETRLWLNTDGSYLPGNWRMPPPPVEPQDPPRLPLTTFAIDPAPDWLAPGPEMTDTFSEDDPPADAAMPSDAPNPEVADNDPVMENAAAPAWDEQAISEFLEQPYYPWHHAVLLEQRRRMRSGEVHYIDHPMFGIVVTLTPHEFEPFVNSPPTPGP